MGGEFRRGSNPDPVTGAAYGGLRRRVRHWLEQSGLSVPVRDWGSYLSTVEITYSGEVTPKALPLDWTKMSGGLPPPQHCASIDVESLCEGPMLVSVKVPWLSYRAGFEQGPNQSLVDSTACRAW